MQAMCVGGCAITVKEIKSRGIMKHVAVLLSVECESSLIGKEGGD